MKAELKPRIRAKIGPGYIHYVFDNRFCIHGVANSKKTQCNDCALMALESIKESGARRRASARPVRTVEQAVAVAGAGVRP